MNFLIVAMILCAGAFDAACGQSLSNNSGSSLTANYLPFPTGTLAIPPTNSLPDGSIITIQSVSYGTLHRTDSPQKSPGFFKSASPTIMFTTKRQSPAGHYLGETDDLWTKAESIDGSGNWYQLRKRTTPKPVPDGFADDPDFYEGLSPSTLSETWEFPNDPKSSPFLRVRISIQRDSTNIASVEFKLPNDQTWREKSASQEAGAFQPHEWLNNELFRAAMGGDVGYVKDLIAQGANPNSTDSGGMSALAIACQDDNEDVVRYLIDHGADVNAHSKGQQTDRTALIAAASNGAHLAIAQLLVDKGADVNIRGELGWTALIWAAQEGSVDCVKYLLSKGADPGIKAFDGKTVVDLTRETVSPGRFAVIEILKKAQPVR
jgi:Ankyrin repeats (3 copies)/Ankyrin repeat